MLNLNNVYNHYSSQMIAPLSNRKSNTQKKDDLKTVYNNMVRQNQHSPFYKFTLSEATSAYAIGIKEAAMALEAESQSLNNNDNQLYKQMTAISDNENVVFASLNNNGTEDLPDLLSIKVDHLATGQTNIGHYLPSGERSIPAGDYTMGISVGNNQYTFQLTVHKGDSNQQIQRNLANSINENNIGVRATIRNHRVNGTSALVLRSEAVGMPKDDDLFFRFNETYLENDIVTKLGINEVDKSPTNAEFYINDQFHTSISNRISLNHTMDLDLLSASDEPVQIKLVVDDEKITDKLKDFTDSYNQLVDIARNSTSQRGATKLFRDITNLTKRHTESIKAAGLSLDENGYMRITDDVDTTKIQKLFDEDLSDFRKDIKKTTQDMTINPLNYVDKIVVTYPNVQGTYPNPYNPSKYSGLLFNDYA
ncbi:MAG: flagellar filament capping protein FliD [Lachnospiraceae bacterium]